MKSKKPLPRCNGFDRAIKTHKTVMQYTEKPHDSQFQRVLRRLSPLLKKHAEILASYEAKNLKKKTHDVFRIVGRCRIYKIATQN